MTSSGKQITPRLNFHIAEDDETVYVVKDNEAGFNIAYADKLFGAFQRLHHADEFEGTVQRVIHKHSGHIWSGATIG